MAPHAVPHPSPQRDRVSPWLLAAGFATGPVVLALVLTITYALSSYRCFPDGTSATLLFAEKLQVCGSGPGSIQNYWFGSEYGNSAAWYWAPVITGAEQLTASGQYAGGDFLPANLGAAPDRCNPFAPSGAHAGGILVALADGSVRNVGAGIRPATWWAACTPASGEMLGNDW